MVGTVLCKHPCSPVPVATLAVTWQRSRYSRELSIQRIPSESASLAACTAAMMCVLCADNGIGSDMNLTGSTLACWPVGLLKRQRLLRSSREEDMVAGSSTGKAEQEPDSDQVSAATQSASVPVTTRIPILPPYSFSQAPLQVHPSILCVQ